MLLKTNDNQRVVFPEQKMPYKQLLNNIGQLLLEIFVTL